MNLSNIIALVVVLLIVALLIATWLEWRKAYNRRAVKHVSRVVQEQTQRSGINRAGEFEWEGVADQMPTFKGQL